MPDSQRKPCNQGHIRAEQHALARFLAADQPNPFLTVPRVISPSQALWPTVPQRIAQTRTPSQALLRCIAPSRLSYQRLPKPFAPNQPPTSNPSGRRPANSPSNHQSKPSPRPTAPGTSPQASPLPATLQAIGPTPAPHQHSPESSARCGRTARRNSLLRLRHSLALGRTDRPRALAAMRATSSIFDSLIICWLQTVTTLIP